MKLVNLILLMNNRNPKIIIENDQNDFFQNWFQNHSQDIDHYLESGLKDIATELFVEE